MTKTCMTPHAQHVLVKKVKNVNVAATSQGMKPTRKKQNKLIREA